MTDRDNLSISYTQQVIAWQPRLYAFVLSLTGNATEADDILQNANVVLLQKQDAFRPDSNFCAWAMQIANFEVLRYRQSHAETQKRYDDALLDQLTATAPNFAEEPSADLLAMRRCMSRLSTAERELLTLRYGGSPLRTIAERLGRTTASLSQTLYRIRAKLAECAKRALGAERRDDS